MARQFLADVDLRARLYLAGTAGTAGKVLTSNGSNNPPTWETVSGGGANQVDYGLITESVTSTFDWGSIV